MRLCSLTSSRFLFLLLVSVARCRPFKNHEFTYTEGLNILTGGPTNFINIKFATVLNCNEALVGVTIKFICEKPRSHSLVEIGMLLIALKRGVRDDGTACSMLKDVPLFVRRTALLVSLYITKHLFLPPYTT